MDLEKRRAHRFLFSEPVIYSIPDVKVNGSVACNISLSGICLVVQEFIPIGTLLELQIHLGQDSKVIWAKAHVVRVREVLSQDCYEIGLQFVNDEKCLRAIADYINTYQSQGKISSDEVSE